jgi:hypothetical protein
MIGTRPHPHLATSELGTVLFPLAGDPAMISTSTPGSDPLILEYLRVYVVAYYA